jgi:hypothetical protein
MRFSFQQEKAFDKNPLPSSQTPHLAPYWGTSKCVQRRKELIEMHLGIFFLRVISSH